MPLKFHRYPTKKTKGEINNCYISRKICFSITATWQSQLKDKILYVPHWNLNAKRGVLKDYPFPFISRQSWNPLFGPTLSNDSNQSTQVIFWRLRNHYTEYIHSYFFKRVFHLTAHLTWLFSRSSLLRCHTQIVLNFFIKTIIYNY